MRQSKAVPDSEHEARIIRGRNPGNVAADRAMGLLCFAPLLPVITAPRIAFRPGKESRHGFFRQSSLGPSKPAIAKIVRRPPGLLLSISFMAIAVLLMLLHWRTGCNMNSSG